MSRFYASITGNRGTATRQGSKASGINGHIRSWNIGVDVQCFVDNGKDKCIIRKTGGSSNSSGEIITTITEE